MQLKDLDYFLNQSDESRLVQFIPEKLVNIDGIVKCFNKMRLRHAPDVFYLDDDILMILFKYTIEDQFLVPTKVMDLNYLHDLDILFPSRQEIVDKLEEILTSAYRCEFITKEDLKLCHLDYKEDGGKAVRKAKIDEICDNDYPKVVFQYLMALYFVFENTLTEEFPSVLSYERRILWAFSTMQCGRLVPTSFIDVLDNLFFDPCEAYDFPIEKFDRVIMHFDKAVLDRFKLSFGDEREKPAFAFWLEESFVDRNGFVSAVLLEYIDLHYEDFVNFFKRFYI